MGLLLAAWPRISEMWSNSLIRKLSLKDGLKLLEDAKVHGRNLCGKANKQKKTMWFRHSLYDREETCTHYGNMVR